MRHSTALLTRISRLSQVGAQQVGSSLLLQSPLQHPETERIEALHKLKWRRNAIYAVYMSLAMIHERQRVLVVPDLLAHRHRQNGCHKVSRHCLHEGNANELTTKSFSTLQLKRWRSNLPKVIRSSVNTTRERHHNRARGMRTATITIDNYNLKTKSCRVLIEIVEPSLEPKPNPQCLCLSATTQQGSLTRRLVSYKRRSRPCTTAEANKCERSR